MSIYHSETPQIKTNIIGEELLNRRTLGTLLAFRWHLETSFKIIKDDVEIGFIKGTNGTEICISTALDWDLEPWVDFFDDCVNEPDIILNCMMCGIKKIVLIVNNNLTELDPHELFDNLYDASEYLDESL